MDNQEIHALLHIVKASGKIAAIYEAIGHGGRPDEPMIIDIDKYLADLIICAVRLSDLLDIDIQSAYERRVSQRNDLAS